MTAGSRRRDRAASILFAVAVFIFILTFSIAIPIYCRPFYYAHIQALDLPGASGFTADQIVAAYNEVLDYLTLPGRSFGTGVMACSESAQAHFADCRVLFRLDAWLLVGSGLCVAVLLVLGKRNWVRLELAGFGPAFWGAMAAVLIPIVVGFLAALDFDRAFVVFHSIFFPGKDNWLFDWNRDQIIRVLPEVFFRNCAILIGASVLVLSAVIIMAELPAHRRKTDTPSE